MTWTFKRIVEGGSPFEPMTYIPHIFLASLTVLDISCIFFFLSTHSKYHIEDRNLNFSSPKQTREWKKLFLAIHQIENT